MVGGYYWPEDCRGHDHLIVGLELVQRCHWVLRRDDRQVFGRRVDYSTKNLGTGPDPRKDLDRIEDCWKMARVRELGRRIQGQGRIEGGKRFAGVAKGSCQWGRQSHPRYFRSLVVSPVGSEWPG